MWKDAKQKLMRKDHSVMRVNGEAELRQAHREVHAFKDDGRKRLRRLDGCESSEELEV